MTAVNENDGKKLELVQVLFRHGERTPSEEEYSLLKYTDASVYEPYGFGQMTNNGRAQAYQLGRTLRERYSNYLSDAYKAEDVYAYLSESDRTMTTLQLVLAGLYPPSSRFLWNPDLNWLPIPYRYTPAKFDVLLKPYLGKKYVEIMKRETDHVIQAKNSNEYSDIVRMVKDEHGLRVSQQKRIDCLADVYNVLHSNVRMNIPLPEWCTREVLARLQDYFVFDLHCFSHTQRMQRMNGGTLIKTFIDNINVNDEATLYNPRKIYLYSGHDMNIAAVLIALGVQDFGYPDYASALILEKYRDLRDNRLYVKLLGRRSTGEEFATLTMPRCDQLCPIEQFLRIARDVIPTDKEMQHLADEFQGSSMNDLFLSDPHVRRRS